MRAHLIVEGWRFVPHSYAVVNQWQLLALSRRDLGLRVVDVAFFRPWQAHSGLFDAADERVLRSLPLARPGESADATLRIYAPFTFIPSTSRLTAVFATLEEQVIRRHQLADPAEYARLQRGRPATEVKTVTPSTWSAQGFYRAGFSSEQVIIVPHGVDVATFHPNPEVRAHVRGRLGIRDGDFAFLSVGAMTGNKGIDLLLRGFAEICRRFPAVRLVLKGLDPLYGSRDFVAKYLTMLSERDRRQVADKITYLGASVPNRDMAMLYQAADAYVSPYRAEGFNLPVLEAAACGLPVICTRGGPTDDFVTDAFARRIESRVTLLDVDGGQASRLNPSVEHLIALMAAVIEDTDWRRGAAKAGAHHVASHYTWDHAVDALLCGLRSCL